MGALKITDDGAGGNLLQGSSIQRHAGVLLT